MSIANYIRERIESRGWEILEIRDISYLWVAEIWKIKSIWSPTDFVVYLSFQADPHDGPNEFTKVRWLHASPVPPVDWAQDISGRESLKSNIGHSTVIGKNQEKYIGEFLDRLDRLRNTSSNMASN